MSGNQGDNQNYITKMEHNPTYRAKKVIPYLLDGNGNAVSQLSTELQIRIAADSTYSYIQYIGKANTSEATSSSTWQIKKLDEQTGTIITYADGDINFDNVWDNREALSYS